MDLLLGVATKGEEHEGDNKPTACRLAKNEWKFSNRIMFNLIMNFFILLSLYCSEVVTGYVVDGVYIISNAL